MKTHDAKDRDTLPELARAPDDGVADALLHWLAHAVILVDARGRVVRMNQRAAEIVAQGDGLLIQHNVLRGVRPTDTAALHRLIGEAAHSGPGNGYAAGIGLRLERQGERHLRVHSTRPKGIGKNSASLWDSEYDIR